MTRSCKGPIMIHKQIHWLLYPKRIYWWYVYLFNFFFFSFTVKLKKCVTLHYSFRAQLRLSPLHSRPTYTSLPVAAQDRSRRTETIPRFTVLLASLWTGDIIGTVFGLVLWNRSEFDVLLLCNALSCAYTTLCCAVLCCAVLCCAVLCCAVWCGVVPYHSTLWFAVLCYFGLYCDLLYRVALCCVILCCVKPLYLVNKRL